MEPESPPTALLRLVLAPGDLSRLGRLPRLIRDGAPHPIETVWHDGDTAPLAAFRGRTRRYRRDGVTLEVMHGTLRGVVADRPACWITLTGPAEPVAAAATTLATELHLSVPRGSLEEEAASLARGGPVPCRTKGPPTVPAGATVTQALAGIILHLTGALLHWTDRCAGDDPVEAVHQARVATRRLRSALSIFKPAAPCPELTALAPMLRDCAARLGQVRDWDVFLAGAGAQLAAALPQDVRYAAMLRAGQKRRDAVRLALRTYLAGPEFRRLQIALACAGSLHPWVWADGVAVPDDLGAFAAQVLDRRAKQVRKAGRGLKDLPTPALHELRKLCKRLRYAAEFFTPLFPHRHAHRYLRRLSAVQEELGLLNDTDAVGPLMAQLGRAGRGHAGGLVEGFAVAASVAARGRIGPVWRRFRAAGRFWDDRG